MHMLSLILALVPLLSWAQTTPKEKDWDLTFSAKGTIGPEMKFESIGRAMVVSADTLLAPQGGFDALYGKFQEDPASKLTVGVFQKASAFRDNLLKCGIDVPEDVLAMKIASVMIFNSKTDKEVDQVLEEMGPKLTYEKKIAFASQLGGIMNQGYDYKRTDQKDDASKGKVTFRDMINAYQNNGKAGVCRDIAFAVSNSLVKMGAKESFIVTYSTDGSGHATVISQDPDNKNKTYNINYNYVTSTEGASPLKHLQQNSTIPSVGVNYNIFDANGKHLTNLPSNLGVLLHEMGGGPASDLDPMLKSENSLAQIGLYNNKAGMGISVAKGLSADGDSVNALVGTYYGESEHFPVNANVVLFNSTRDTNLKGKQVTNGLYFDADQTIQSAPHTVELGKGNVSMQIFGKVGVRGGFYNVTTEINDKKGITLDSDINMKIGGAATYKSESEKTVVSTSVLATTGMALKDVRESGKMTWDLRDVTGSVVVSQQISENLKGFASGTVTARKGDLGIQSRQEVGLNFKVLDKNGEVVIGHEGQVKGREIAFVPGSIEKYYMDVSFMDKKNNAITGGVWCASKNAKDCGIRLKGIYKFPVR
jgi:hypothetical protein